jgi:Tfp pilus assembly protein PilW
VADAAAWHASDATTHQNIHCNQNDNEATAQCTANASSWQYLWLIQDANESMP